MIAISIRSNRQQRGIALIEAVAALTVVASVMAGMAVLSGNLSDDAKVSNTATHLMTVGTAANYFVRDHRSEIMGIATSTRAVRISVQELVNEGYLRNGFLAANGQGQNACVMVLQPSADNLSVMTVAEGAPFNDAQLGYLVSFLGSGGGGVYQKEPNVLNGAMGGWRVPVADFDNKLNTDLVGSPSMTCNGSAGRIRVVEGTPVIANWITQNAFGRYLSRVDTGDPVDTTMETDFKLGGHSIAGLRTIVDVPAPNAPCAAAQVNEMGRDRNIGYECLPSGMGYRWTTSSSCGSLSRIGDLASDVRGRLMVCQKKGMGSTWEMSSGMFWNDAVDDWAALNAITCTPEIDGQTRTVRNASDGAARPRTYSCNGSAWHPLSIDNDGNLTVPGTITTERTVINDKATISKLDGTLEITKITIQNGFCAPNGSLARDASGVVLSCQNGFWKKAQLGINKQHFYNADGYIGQWDLCMMSGYQQGRNHTYYCIVSESPAGSGQWYASRSGYQCHITCIR